jgi:hypothetical protein
MMQYYLPMFVNNHKMFKKFLCTFFFACSLNLSAKDLHRKNGIITTSKLISIDDHKLIWFALADCGISPDHGDGSTTNRRSVKPFWRTVKDCVNPLLIELFAQEYEGKLLVVIDDDKMHFEMNDGYGGPNITRLIGDNVRAFVCNQMVMCASQVIIGCRFDRDGDAAAP